MTGLEMQEGCEAMVIKLYKSPESEELRSSEEVEEQRLADLGGASQNAGEVKVIAS